MDIVAKTFKIHSQSDLGKSDRPIQKEKKIQKSKRFR